MPANSTPITARGPRPTTCASSAALLRYSQGTATDGFSATAMAYSNTWNSTDQVPLRAITTGQIGLYGELDPTDGGDTSRFSLSARMAQIGRRRLVEGQCLSGQIRVGPVQQLHLSLDDRRSGQRRPVSSARRSRLRRRRRLAHRRRLAVRPADRNRVRRAKPLRRHHHRTEQHGSAPVPVEYPARSCRRGQCRHLCREHGALDRLAANDARLARRLFRRLGEFDAAAGEFRKYPRRRSAARNSP